MVERFLVMLIPIATLMLPLIRFAPPLYSWQVRRRIYRWYGALRDIEQHAVNATTAAERGALLARLERVEGDVGKIHVPLGYAESHYHLRTHIQFIRHIIETGQGRSCSAGPGAAPPTV
jgi:hypothetical protein